METNNKNKSKHSMKT